MQAKTLNTVQKYLQDKLSNPNIRLKPSQSDDDMAEVYIKDEFVGTLYRDVDGGEVSFDFNMSIIDADLS
jgi:hypothetical protein